MGWLEGVLTGYADRHYQIQKDKMAQAELAAKREEQVFKTLMNSPYSEIKDYALAGVLDLANPRRRKGGVAGWMGEVEKTPYLDAIRRARERIGADPEYARSQLQEGNEYYPTQVPQEQGGGPPPTPSITQPAGSVPGAAPGQPTAALPETSKVEGGPGIDPTPAPPPPPPPGQFGPRIAQSAAAADAGAPPAPPPPYSTWQKFTNPGGTDWYGRNPYLRDPNSFDPNFGANPMAAQAAQVAAQPGMDPYARPPGFDPNYAANPAAAEVAQAAAQAPPEAAQAAAAPGAAPAPGGAPVGPPASPAGPPLNIPPAQTQTATGPGAGLPGGSVNAVGPRAVLPAARTRLPGIIPTDAELFQQKEQAEIMGQVQGWQRLYREMGDPDWEQKGIQAVLDQKRRNAGGAGLKEGNPRQLPDGSWVQDLYDPYSGQLINSIPHQGPLAGGTPAEKEALAFELFGKVGEDPRATIRRISPTAMGRVSEELRHRKALAAAEVSLARANAMANAELSAQAKSQLIETLNGKWTRLQEPIRETARQFNAMQTGLRRFMATGDERERVGAVEMIRVAFERILDPTSVVREGEYARQVDGLGIPQRFNGYIQRMIEGGGAIDQKELAGMVETARQFLETMQGWNDNERGRIEDRAASHGIDPGFIFGGGVRQPAPTTTTTTTTTPAAGGGNTPAAGGAGAGAAPGATPTINWNSPLRYDPVTRKMVPAG